MLAQAEPAALAGAHSALLVHSIRGRRDEFAGSPRGAGRAGGTNRGGAWGDRAVVEPVMLVQARLLVGAQVPVGVDVRRIVEVALAIGDLDTQAVQRRLGKRHEGHPVTE